MAKRSFRTSGTSRATPTAHASKVPVATNGYSANPKRSELCRANAWGGDPNPGVRARVLKRVRLARLA